ncbi:hypothetical protein [Nocardia sp. BMG111209]|uniref:hypothetical protein n=1 Tax=Nocardia sp. BMG111209 TaxID=1160137 RepID=UPI0003772D3F|nr:hypothetical protein [Nocardia sp. BMG111209]
MRRNYALAALSAAFIAGSVVTAGVSSAGTGMCSFVDISIQFCHTSFEHDPNPMSPGHGPGAGFGSELGGQPRILVDTGGAQHVPDGVVRHLDAP